jgi:hypothetical protein
MTMSNAAEENFFQLLFQAATWTNVATASGTIHYLSLHTSNPGETGNQLTNEIAYTNYARVAVTRNGTNWGVTPGDPTVAANLLAFVFPTCGATPGTATHFGIGTLVSGAGELLIYGALTASLAISSGITPRFDTNQLQIRVD